MSGSVTIKAGSAYDAPWIVAAADDSLTAEQQVATQRAYILGVFGMDSEDPDIKPLTLAEVIAQAGYHFQGVWAKAGGGGNRRSGGRKAASADLGEAASPAQEPQAPAQEPSTPPATEAKASEPEAASEAVTPEAVAEQLGAEIIEDKVIHPHQDVLDEIASAKDKKALQAIFHGNKEAMQGDVLEALQARAKAL